MASAVAATAQGHPRGERLEHLQGLPVVVEQRMARPGGSAVSAGREQVWRCGCRCGGGCCMQASPLPGHVGACWATGPKTQGLQRPPPHGPVGEQQLRQRPGAQASDGPPGAFDRSHRHAAARPHGRLLVNAQHDFPHVAHGAAQRLALLRPKPAASLIQHLHPHGAEQAQARRQRAGCRQPLTQSRMHRSRPGLVGDGASTGDADPGGRAGRRSLRAR